jgi:alpha-amylase
MNNPEVRHYTFDVLNFWLDPNQDGKFDDGVDGFALIT